MPFIPVVNATRRRHMTDVKGQNKLPKPIHAASAYAAFRKGQFIPVFQPLVQLRTGQLVGFEVLARWKHPTLGLILPNRFIFLAEKRGWISELTSDLLRKAFTALSSIPEPLTLSFNISPVQLNDPHLPGLIREAAEGTGFRLNRLVIEVTESALLGDMDSTLSVVRELKAMGCMMSLDDCGTGYSSLLHLQVLPFDELKVDRSFISSMTEVRRSRTIAGAVAGLAQSLDLRAVAEGVETQEQAEMALLLGCDLGQGWFYGRPGPAEELLSVVRAERKKLPTTAMSSMAFSNPLGGMNWDGIRTVFDSLANGITLSDARSPDLPLIYANASFEQITGYSIAEIYGQNCRFLQGPDKNQPGLTSLRQAILEQRETRAVLRNFRKDGTPFWNELYLSPIRNHDGTLTHYLGIQNDITSRVEMKEKLAHLAHHDLLTGLPNRAMLMQRIELAISRAKRGGQTLILLFLDLNNFKHVNDMFGHEAGDELLKAVGHRLAASARSHEMVARLGGDEFVVLLEGLQSDEHVPSVIERLNTGLQQPVLVADQIFRPQASIGMAMYPRDGENPKELLRAADMAMYAQKYLKKSADGRKFTAR
jgi:diguanylate cyclase (GGDEF)-like protein/PAS domain S-box-containing protein